MSINTGTTPPSLRPYELVGKINCNDNAAVDDLITRVCKNSGVKSAEVRDGHLYVTVKGYDEEGGLKPGREVDKLGFIHDHVEGVIKSRAGSQKVQTSVGRGAGASGGVNI